MRLLCKPRAKNRNVEISRDIHMRSGDGDEYRLCYSEIEYKPPLTDRCAVVMTSQTLIPK